MEQTNNKKTYQIEIDFKGFAVLGVLLVASMSSLFWVGVLVGKAERVPEHSQQGSQVEITAASPEKLESMQLEQSKTAPAIQNVPAPTTNDTKNDKLVYTVQLLAVSNKSRAESYMRQLQEKGFDAYVQAVKQGDKQFYRVRVGRVNKTEVQKLQQKLLNTLAIKGSPPKIFEIQP